MMQCKKIIIFWGIYFLFLNFCPIKNIAIPVQLSSVIAAEDDQKDEKKEEAGEKKEDEENPCPECPECPDPAKVVLRGLEEKKTAIEKQQKILDMGKKELETLSEQIDEKVENNNALLKQIKADMALLTKTKTQRELDKEAAHENKIGRLVKMYAGMKPKKAAEIVDKMNLEVAMEIFSRMREASAGQILAFVNPEKAAKISERLAFRRK